MGELGHDHNLTVQALDAVPVLPEHGLLKYRRHEGSRAREEERAHLIAILAVHYGAPHNLCH